MTDQVRCQASTPDRPEPINGRRPLVGSEALTLTQVAKILNLETKTVVAYVRRGELVGQQIGRRWTFSQAAVDAFLEPMPDWTFEVQFRGMNGEIRSAVPSEIPQPSTKTLKAVEKLVSLHEGEGRQEYDGPQEAEGPSGAER
jgi:excisionase family DNA binding protein